MNTGIIKVVVSVFLFFFFRDANLQNLETLYFALQL